MRETIIGKLNETAENRGCRILYAVESGSRAWGFASPDSDYDVRFIYAMPKESYLRLEKMRDVIELPVSGELDINGWDLQKTLRLLHSSNPTLFEWFSSPIVYVETEFADRFRKLMLEYYNSKKSLYHYISMAEGNYREYLKGETVRAKKYFYVLRPILACRWIIDRGTPPPMLFSELAEAELPEYLLPETERLLDIKMNSPEVKEIPKIEKLNQYMDKSIEEIKALIRSMPDSGEPDWEKLNEFFMSVVE